MQTSASPACSFVVRVSDIPALRFLDAKSPQPCSIEWIDRATDRRLRPTTVWQLNRTLHAPSVSPSVRRLHANSGIRSTFVSEKDRNTFSRFFAAAKSTEAAFRTDFITASFKSLQDATITITQLLEAGVPPQAMHVLHSRGVLEESKLELPNGHGKLELASDITMGGLLGIALGLVVLSVPLTGVVAMGGLLTTSAIGAIPAVSGLLGVTGSAMARMVQDYDVDGNALAYYERQIQRGAILLSVDLREAALSRDEVGQMLIAVGSVINKR